jgi:hypothetical protein
MPAYDPDWMPTHIWTVLGTIDSKMIAVGEQLTFEGSGLGDSLSILRRHISGMPAWGNNCSYDPKKKGSDEATLDRNSDNYIITRWIVKTVPTIICWEPHVIPPVYTGQEEIDLGILTGASWTAQEGG